MTALAASSADPVLPLSWWLALAATAYGIAALTLSWVILPWLNGLLRSGPLDGLLLLLVRGWLAVWHRPTWEGLEHLPHPVPEGLLIVSNHASGIDPFLLQARLPRRIRWMMAQDQMFPALRDAWQHIEAIPITYGPEDASAFREAVRHVQGGGLLGLFPEGAIARPPGQIMPFLGGIGLLVARAKVPVALFFIDGAPYAETAGGSLFQRSRSRVRCLGLIDYRGNRDANAINADLRRRLAEASGWPLIELPAGSEPAARHRSSREAANAADTIRP